MQAVTRVVHLTANRQRRDREDFKVGGSAGIHLAQALAWMPTCRFFLNISACCLLLIICMMSACVLCLWCVHYASRVTCACVSLQVRAKTSLMTQYCSQYKAAEEVPDPYYGGPAGFERVLDLLDDASRGLLQHIEQQQQKLQEAAAEKS